MQEEQEKTSNIQRPTSNPFDYRSGQAAQRRSQNRGGVAATAKPNPPQPRVFGGIIAAGREPRGLSILSDKTLAALTA